MFAEASWVTLEEGEDSWVQKKHLPQLRIERPRLSQFIEILGLFSHLDNELCLVQPKISSHPAAGLVVPRNIPPGLTSRTLLCMASDGSSPTPASALTIEQLEDIQASCLADDIPIDFSRMSLWDEPTVRAYFESGGEMVAAGAELSHLDSGGETVAAGAEPSGRALRWAVDISTWDPTPAQWTLLLGLLTDEVRLPACPGS